MNIIGASILLTQKYNGHSRYQFYKAIKIIPHNYNAQPKKMLVMHSNSERNWGMTIFQFEGKTQGQGPIVVTRLPLYPISPSLLYTYFTQKPLPELDYQKKYPTNC